MKLPSRARRLAAAGVVGLAGAGLVAGCSSADGRAVRGVTAGPAPYSPPLTDAVTDSTGSVWAAIPMGHRADENTFWELFRRPPGSSSWRLATPPGVADNGGLVLAPTAAGILTGFVPSQYLHFSPLSSTTDGGRTWVPGLLPGPLVPGPDSLAAAGGGTTYALLSTGGGEVVTSAGNTSSWTRLTNRESLAGSSSRPTCRSSRLTALAIAPGVLLVGGTCSQPGQVALWARRGERWSPVAPALPAGMSKRRIGLLRLEGADGAVLALLDAPSVISQTIVAAWSTDGGSTWSMSSGLAVPAADALTGAGTGPGRSAYVLLQPAGHPDAPEVLDVGGKPGAGWTRVAPPPAGTQAVVLAAAGGDTALVARGGGFSAYSLTGAGSSWTRVQSMTVAVPYGSSS